MTQDTTPLPTPKPHPMINKPTIQSYIVEMQKDIHKARYGVLTGIERDNILMNVEDALENMMRRI